MGWWGMFRHVQIGANNYVSKCWFFYKQYLETRTWSKLYMVKVVIFWHKIIRRASNRIWEGLARELGKLCLKSTYYKSLNPNKFLKYVCKQKPMIKEITVMVGNKAKVRISKWDNLKTKHAKFSKKQIFLTPWYAHVCFSENLVCFVFKLPLFWDSPFYLITDVITITSTSNINTHSCCQRDANSYYRYS